SVPGEAAMPIEGEYEPSPWAKVAEQVARYESSGGTDGAELDGVPCVVLWTRGRRTGTVRKSPLIRVRAGDRYAVVASMGGAPKHPTWYLNLLADPHVTLQDGPDVTDFSARVAHDDERSAWWALASEVWPSYDDYQAKT